MTLILPDNLAKQIEQIAEQENRTPVEVIQSLLEHYQPVSSQSLESDPLEKIIGIFDEDISDMSDSVRTTMTEFYRKKYENSD